MTERELNLDELLGPDAVRHYLGFITPGADNIFGDQRYRFDTTAGASLGRLGWNMLASEDDDATYSLAHTSGNDIEARGRGAQTCSSSFEVATRRDAFVWDVCEYYRLLGVSPYATRPQLRRGFFRRGGARGSKPRLTYAMKQLLDPFVRAAYDRAIPTQPFLLDVPTQEALKRRAVLQALRETARTGIEVTDDDVLARWGMKRNRPGAEEPPENLVRDMKLPPVSGNGGIGEYGPDSTALGSTTDLWQIRWAWYVWYGANIFEQDWDPRPLERWQNLIRHELSAIGTTLNFAVGLHAGAGWKIFQTSEGTCIVFIGRGEYPTTQLAAEAVSYIMSHHAVRENHANSQRYRGRGSH